jgi:hypothetical protein
MHSLLALLDGTLGQQQAPALLEARLVVRERTTAYRAPR